MSGYLQNAIRVGVCFSVLSCLPLLAAGRDAERLPNAIFAWMGEERTGIRGDRLPFFDEKGVYVRPPEEIRAFRSTSVDAQVEQVMAEIPDAKFASLFANCYPNTLDTTVSYNVLPDGDDDTFVYTGDIPAMWLRDSSAQVWPYLPLVKDDKPLRRMIRGVLRRQFKSILIDPYANAFNPDASGRGHPDAPTEMKPEIWERKYEIDSLCYPLRLAYGYWQVTDDTSVFDATWLAVLDKILETFKVQQHKEGWKTPYCFNGDRVPNRGYGAPVKPVGLIASFFRPSDDACVYPFLVPSNFFAVDVLRKAAEILKKVNRDTNRMRSCYALADEVEKALQKHAIVKHPKYGDIYAYEIDGFGNALLIDDANVPSLLALPYFSGVKKDDPVYLNTRRFVFSKDNPYYFEGKAGAGIGGPHCGFYRIWPMSYVFKALTATDDEDIIDCLRLLRNSDAGLGLMHESYDKDDPSVYSRAWFAWANSIFGELILKLRSDGKLHLLKLSKGSATRKKDVFSLFRPGAVKPRGWMLDRARAAANGLTGHLDEYDDDFIRAYSPSFRPPVSNLTWQTGSWSFEGGAYWFDGAVRLAEQLDDEKLRRKMAARLAPVLTSAKTNSLGLLTWLDRNDPEVKRGIAKADNAFALAKSGMLARALSAYWAASGDARATNVLAHAFDDVDLLRLGNALHLPSAAFEAYRLTQDARTAAALDAYYADPDAITSPARRFSFSPTPDSFLMTNDPRLGEDWRPQHGVMMNESLIAWLRGWQWTGHDRFRTAVFGWMDWLDANALQPHGVIVADEAFGYPGSDRGTETCTVAASIWLRLQLLLATGDGRWADDIERALFNAAPACVSRDYRRHVYFQSPNRTTPKRPVHRRGEVPVSPYRYERKHFPLCCTADLTRIIPMGIQAKWLSDDEGVVACVYGPDEVRVNVAGANVCLKTKTDYPFRENVDIVVVEADREAEWTLKLRVPAWCERASLKVNGKMMPIATTRGFVGIRRMWRQGDQVELLLPMTPRREIGTDANTGLRYATMTLGPLLMAAPLQEFDDNTPKWPQQSDWKIDPDELGSRAEVVRTEMPAPFDWPLAAPIRVRVRVRSSDGQLELVPYGSTKFRVSMFPLDKTERMKQ